MLQVICWTFASSISCRPILQRARPNSCWSSEEDTPGPYGSTSPGTFSVICEDGIQQIQIVKAYKHLGGWLHHRTDQRKEMAQKAAVAHAAFLDAIARSFMSTHNWIWRSVPNSSPSLSSPSCSMAQTPGLWTPRRIRHISMRQFSNCTSASLVGAQT